MRAYLIGFAASLALLVAASGAPYLVSPARAPSEILWLTVILLMLPCAAALLVVQIIHTLRPRRLFDPRVHRPEFALGLGVIAGFLCAASAVFWRAFFPLTPDDHLLVIACAALAAALSTLVSPRAKRGRCVRCNTALERMDLCHECGTPTRLQPVS